jgi:hypothetical protein
MNFNQLINTLDLSKIDQDEVKFEGARRGFIKKARAFSFKTLLVS